MIRCGNAFFKDDDRDRSKRKTHEPPRGSPGQVLAHLRGIAGLYTTFLCLLLAVAMVLFRTTASLPQVAADLAGALHVDLDKPGSYSPGNRASGRITNDSDYRLTNVRLRLDASDAAGQALPPTFGWVDGDVPAHGRAWFRIPMPPSAVAVSVSVIDFNFVSIQSP